MMHATKSIASIKSPVPVILLGTVPFLMGTVVGLFAPLTRHGALNRTPGGQHRSCWSSLITFACARNDAQLASPCLRKGLAGTSRMARAKPHQQTIGKGPPWPTNLR